MKTMFLALFSLCIVASASLAQEYQLRYALPVNTMFKFKQVEQTTALAQSNDGRSTDIDRNTTRYFTLTVEKIGDAIEYRLVQDTAIVEENNEDPRVQRQNLLSQNILTGKPVLVRQSATGEIEDTRALEPLQSKEKLGPAVSDAMFLRQAAILPRLPDRPLREGMRWTEHRSDTLQPSKTIPGFGTGSGVRYLGGNTEYTVTGTETIDGNECLVLKWKSHGSMEEAVIFKELEEFSEEFTEGSGEMKIAIDTGLPVWVEVYSNRESTQAVFGPQSSVIPASITTHTTLEVFSQ